MSYEESCKRFARLVKEVGITEANRMMEDDPFLGCLFGGWDDEDYEELLQSYPDDDHER